jgi:hypothetical protein
MTAPHTLPGPPATGAPPLNGSRLVAWGIYSLIAGWVIAYNILRFGGEGPRDAAWPSLAIGVGIGVVIFAVAVVVHRRLVASGRLRPHHLEEIPPPERLDSRQRGVLDALWPSVGVLSALALVVGAVLAIDWYGTDGARSTTKIVLGGWDVLVGVWLALETVELRRKRGEAVESIALAALLTAVLAGVAFSLEMFAPLQIALVVVAGSVAILAHVASWRLLGSRGIPLGAVAAAAVTALSIVLPIVL